MTDLLIRLQGKPPKMIKTFEKLDRAVEEYRCVEAILLWDVAVGRVAPPPPILLNQCSQTSFFTLHGWKWENRNGQAMLASMSEVRALVL